ncbi:MAG: MucBP domain-containing protein [Eubacterium sp.]|nr:MucBP domain-containing protein [Eubacterium sp.]
MKLSDKNRITMLLTSALAAAALLAAFMLASVCAGTMYAYADEEAYTYTVTIYSGKEGYFGKKGNTVKKLTGFKYGDTCTIDASELDIKVKDPDKYYVRGLKLSGHDNDEIAGAYYQTYTFDVKEDLSFSAAYGMKGGMVRYTVEYVDEDGNALRDEDTYYGMPGDKPVVSFKHIKNYAPVTNNAMKTLTEDEDDNHFVFTYKSNVIEEDDDTGNDTGDENGGNGNGNNAGGSDDNRAGAAGGRIINAWNTPGADGEGSAAEDGNTGDVSNLDDEEVPETDAGDGAEEGRSGGTGLNAGVVAGSTGLVVLLILLFLIFRRKKKNS